MKLVFEAENFQELRDQIIQTALQLTKAPPVPPPQNEVERKRKEKEKVGPLSDAKGPG